MTDKFSIALFFIQNSLGSRLQWLRSALSVLSSRETMWISWTLNYYAVTMHVEYGGESHGIDDIFMSTEKNKNGSVCNARNVTRDKADSFYLCRPVLCRPRNLFAHLARPLTSYDHRQRMRKLGWKPQQDIFVHRLVYRVIAGLSTVNTRD